MGASKYLLYTNGAKLAKSKAFSRIRLYRLGYFDFNSSLYYSNTSSNVLLTSGSTSNPMCETVPTLLIVNCLRFLSPNHQAPQGLVCDNSQLSRYILYIFRIAVLAHFASRAAQNHVKSFHTTLQNILSAEYIHHDLAFSSKKFIKNIFHINQNISSLSVNNIITSW